MATRYITQMVYEAEHYTDGMKLSITDAMRLSVTAAVTVRFNHALLHLVPELTAKTKIKIKS